jgi:outer membrane protein assembly factor BamE (lipoprotein component of BamABCDE complex)
MANLGKKRKLSVVLVLLAVFLSSSGCRTRAKPPSDKKEARAEKPVASRPAHQVMASSFSRLTGAKLDQVKCGMTEGDIQEVLGPATTAQDLPGFKRQLMWKEGEKMVKVVLEKDKAMVCFASHMDQEPAKITKANADRVVPGMTEQEVMDILGPSRGGSWAGASKTVIWEHGRQQIEATFVEGRLTIKEVRGF